MFSNQMWLRSAYVLYGLTLVYVLSLAHHTRNLLTRTRARKRSSADYLGGKPMRGRRIATDP